MDDNEETTGLGVLRSSLRSAVEEGGPLASVISESMRKAGVPEEISVDYEPYRAPEREAPARQTQYRDELMRQLQSTMQKLLAPKPEPKNLLEALSRRFVMPTGKSGDLLIARQERAEKEAEEDLKRREAILSILDKQARLEREHEQDLARERAAEAEAAAKGRQGVQLQSGGGRRYVFKDGKKASAVFHPEFGSGYLNDAGDFVPESQAPEGTRVVTGGALNPITAAEFNKNMQAFVEEKIGLRKMSSYLKDIEKVGSSGIEVIANRFAANLKSLFGSKKSQEEFASLSADARQQGLIGATRLEVLGPGVVTKEDAIRLEKNMGGRPISAFFDPKVAKELIESMYRDKTQRAQVLSEILQLNAPIQEYDPASFVLDEKDILGGDVLRRRTPREKPKDRTTTSTRPPATGANLPMTKRVGNETWTLKVDAKGNRAYVSPDGKKFEEVR